MIKYFMIFAAMAVLLAPVGAGAEVKDRAVLYNQGATTLEGYLAWDDSFKGLRPGILVVHEWGGLNEYAKGRARMLAELGYVAFAADIYGQGVRAKNRAEAAALSKIYKNDRKLMRARVRAAHEVLKAQALTDPARTAAIGYCFGGTVALELARSGTDALGVVSFHGGLSTPVPAAPGEITAKVLVLHGADDPNVDDEEVQGFQEEMRASGADWLMVSYGGAVHSFTNPARGTDNSKGAAYNADADRRSWVEMRSFFGELFSR